jgi:two-component system, NarL family, sensor histidine kinase UhpB
MSLRLRINLLISVLMVAFLVAAGAVIIDDTRRSIREEIKAGTRITVQLMTAVAYAGQFFPSTSTQRDFLLSFLKNLGRVRAHDIVLEDGLGNVVYKSPQSTYKAGRWAPDWFSRMVSPKTETVAISLPGATLRIVPDVSRSVLDAWDDLSDLMMVAAGFFLLLIVLLFWLVGRSLRPLQTVLGGLSGMAQGRFDTRLPEFGAPEFSSISRTFNRMAQALQDSVAENQRLALIAQQSSDAIVIQDLEGTVTFWNPAAERLFGYHADEVLGRSATVLASGECAAEIERNLETVRARGVIENQETQRLAKDGRVLDVALSTAPLVDPQRDEVIGSIVSLRDITEHKRAVETERELRQNRELTQLIQKHVEEERRSLARELHDELGQCVAAIKTIGASIANRSRDTAPEIHESSRMIVQVAGRLYDSMHGIVRQLRPSALDNLGLRETLEEALSALQSQHPEIALRLETRGELDHLGEALNINAYRIVQECLTNVLRHAGASRANVFVTRIADDGGDRIEIEVRDNGRGIAGSGAEASPGYGILGMRERVQALRGSFAFDSEAGQGVRVRVTLPVTGPVGAEQGASA